MLSNSELYRTWCKRLSQLEPDTCRSRLTNMLLLVVGIYRAKSVHLSLVARKLPVRAKKLSLGRAPYRVHAPFLSCSWLMVMLENSDLLSELLSQMNNSQQRAFACDCAAHVLPIYETLFPEDSRLRQAIQTTRDYISGHASHQQLFMARQYVNEALNEIVDKLSQENDPRLTKALWVAEAVENATWDTSVSQAWNTALEASMDSSEREWQLQCARFYLTGDSDVSGS
jgi:hypothetical protein